MPNGC